MTGVRSLITLLAVLALAGPARCAAPYMYRETPRHTGVARAGESISTAPKLIWKYEPINVGIHTASKSSPVADETRVYVGADDGRFYAFDKRTGQLQWQWACRPCGQGIHGSPAIDDRCVYIGDYGGWLSALDKSTGKLVWEVQLGHSIGASPVIVGERVYVAVETRHPDGFLAAVDRQSGRSLYSWVWRLGDHSHCTPSIDQRSGKAYLGSNRGFFHCLNAEEGRERWRFAAHDALAKLPVDGQRPKYRGQIKSTAAIAGDVVLFTSWDHHLYCLDRGEGGLRWRFETNDRTMSSPSVDIESNRVYLGSHDQHIYAVDLKTGMEVWRFKTGGRLISSALIVPRRDGRGKLVVIGSHDQTLYLLDADNGSMVWRADVGSPITNVACISDHRLYVSTDGGQLLCWK